MYVSRCLPSFRVCFRSCLRSVRVFVSRGLFACVLSWVDILRALWLAPCARQRPEPQPVTPSQGGALDLSVCSCLRSYVRLVDTALLGSTPLTVLSDHWSSADRELLLPMRSSPLTGLRTEGILGVPPTSGTTPDTPPQTGTVFAGMVTLPVSALNCRWATWGSP
jgi:hypothetical protein